MRGAAALLRVGLVSVTTWSACWTPSSTSSDFGDSAGDVKPGDDNGDATGGDAPGDSGAPQVPACPTCEGSSDPECHPAPIAPNEIGDHCFCEGRAGFDELSYARLDPPTGAWWLLFNGTDYSLPAEGGYQRISADGLSVTADVEFPLNGYTLYRDGTLAGDRILLVRSLDHPTEQYHSQVFMRVLTLDGVDDGPERLIVADYLGTPGSGDVAVDVAALISWAGVRQESSAWMMWLGRFDLAGTGLSEPAPLELGPQRAGGC
jgi:hypothetical protein